MPRYGKSHNNLLFALNAKVCAARAQVERRVSGRPFTASSTEAPECSKKKLLCKTDYFLEYSKEMVRPLAHKVPYSFCKSKQDHMPISAWRTSHCYPLANFSYE